MLDELDLLDDELDLLEDELTDGERLENDELERALLPAPLAREIGDTLRPAVLVPA